MQPACCCHRLLDRTKYHGEHDLKCSVEAPDRIGKQAGMLVDRCGNKRVRELEQQGPTCTQKDRCLAVDPPLHGVTTEHSLKRSSGKRSDYPKLILELLRGD